MAHKVLRVQPDTTAMEDVMQQVVENQMGHPAASDRDGGEVQRCTSGGSV